jgi:hypothetical protein
MGFGIPWRFPPDLVEVDYTYGYTGTIPDDVAAAVLETAAAAYQSPDLTTVSEQIDDYRIQTAPNMGGMRLTSFALELADWYAGPVAA